MAQETSLPASWLLMKLGSLLSFVGSGITPRGGKTIYKKEGIPFIRSQNVYPDGLRLGDVAYITTELHHQMERTHVRSGDVLLNITGASIGRSTYVPEWLTEANVNQHVCILRPTEFITPKYLSALLNSNFGQKQIIESQSGVTRQGLNYSQVKALLVPVPPLPEQERIVAKIEELFSQLDAGTAALRRAQAGLKRYKASVLKAACEGRLVPQDTSDEPAEALLRGVNKFPYRNVEFVTTLPDGWSWAKLADISKRITDGTHQPPKFEQTGINFLFVKHIVGGEIKFENTRFISEETYAKLQARCPVEIGDVLYSAVGSYGVAVPVHTSRPFSFQRHIAHIKPLSIISFEYLAVALNSEVGKKQANQYARGVAQKTVTLGDLSRYAIPLPPLAEQYRIVAEVERRLSVVAQVEAAVAAGVARSERLRQAILRRAFEGRLVPQDPSDEPAELLLESIKAQVETTPKQARLF